MEHHNVSNGGQKQVSRIFRAILLILVLFLTVWATVNVAEGIVEFQLYAGRDKILIYMFAAALQAFVSVSFALIPLFFMNPSKPGIDICVGRTLAALFVAAVSFAIMYFEMFHGVLIAVRNSQGTELVAREKKELLRLNEQITTVSAQVAAVYKNRLQSLGDLAEAARKGQDETGIAKCGAICKGRLARLADLRERFSDLSQLGAAPAAPSSDVRGLFLDVLERAKLLGGQVGRLGQFHQYADKSGAPINILQAQQDIAKDVEAKRVKYDQLLEIDEKSMTIQATVEIFRNILLNFDGVRPIYLLAVVYPLLPFLVILSATALGWRIRTYNASFNPVAELAQEVEQEVQTNEHLAKLAELKKSSWRAWLATRFYNRGPQGEGPGPQVNPA